MQTYKRSGNTNEIRWYKVWPRQRELTLLCDIWCSDKACLESDGVAKH